ncbi:MAG: hypothetical protein US50_C0066G0001, partial [Candidatus Nomurabacteria bacterium GW2011_GWB1_37_5]
SDLYLVKLNFFDSQATVYKKQLGDLVGATLVPGERIFLTGSPVFWLGSLKQNFNLLQVRGGKDENSTHKTWALGAYQIREGESPQLLEGWLSVFGVSRLLYQGEGSDEYYKDFKNEKRFTSWYPVDSEGDNKVYDFPNSLVRLASTELLKVPAPAAGDDKRALIEYVSYLKDPVKLTYKAGKIELSVMPPSDTLISFSISYDTHWHITEGQGRLKSDSFGNMVLEPGENNSRWQITYTEEWWEMLPGVGFTLVFLLILNKSDSFAAYFKKKTPSLGISVTNEEENY